MLNYQRVLYQFFGPDVVGLGTLRFLNRPLMKSFYSCKQASALTMGQKTRTKTGAPLMGKNYGKHPGLEVQLGIAWEDFGVITLW